MCDVVEGAVKFGDSIMLVGREDDKSWMCVLWSKVR